MPSCLYKNRECYNGIEMSLFFGLNVECNVKILTILVVNVFIYS